MKRSGAVSRALTLGIAFTALCSTAWAQSATFRFNQARQPLADAIIRLSRVIGVNVLFESELLEGREAPDLNGEMTATEALDRLLAGSGLVARQTDARSIYIQRGLVAAVPRPVPPAPEPRTELPVPLPLVVIEEILVTAQKREESLQNVPIVVQVMSQAALQRAGVKDFGTINKVASNIQVVQGPGAPVIAIRGIRANAPGAASESPTAVHLNGNYISQAVSLTGMFFDLERVEVLAGPQGTLFGRNAAAGVINVITRKPQPQFAAGAELEVGSRDLRRATAVFNVPTSETVAWRLAGQSLTRDGYFRNGLDDAEEQSLRLGVSWRSSDTSHWLFTGDYSRNTPKGSSDNLIVAGIPGNGLDVPPLRDNGALYGDADRAGKNQEFWGAALEYEQDLGFAAFTLQGSHRNVSQSDRVYGSQNLTNPTEFGHSTTAELRLTSPSGGRLEYVGGLYLFRESKYGGTGTFATQASDDLPFRIQILGQATNAGAAFGQATWSPTDAVHLTLGARYNYDHKRSSSLVIAPPASQFYEPPEADRWNHVTYKGSVSYDVGPKNMLFASVATGYKSGTFAFGPTPRVDPQNVLAVEIGSKNRFLDDRLQVNMNAYYTDYKSLEQPYTTPIPGTTLFMIAVTNTDGALMRGVDLDADWAASARDRFRARVNYLDARYHAFDLRPLGGLDYSGRQVANTTPWALNLGYTHTWQALAGSLDFSIDAQYRASRGISATGNYDAAGQPYEQEAYTLLDVGLRYAPTSQRWRLGAYANNVFDEIYYGQANYNVQRGYNVYAQLAPPRTLGLVFGIDF
jgi:iron complex outermembrane recepter protein